HNFCPAFFCLLLPAFLFLLWGRFPETAGRRALGCADRYVNRDHPGGLIGRPATPRTNRGIQEVRKPGKTLRENRRGPTGRSTKFLKRRERRGRREDIPVSFISFVSALQSVRILPHREGFLSPQALERGNHERAERHEKQSTKLICVYLCPSVADS